MTGINQSFTTDEVTYPGSPVSTPVYLGFKPKVVFTMGCGVTTSNLGTAFHTAAEAGFGWSPDPSAGIQTAVGSGGADATNDSGSYISESIYAAANQAGNTPTKTIDMLTFDCDTDEGHPLSGFTWQISPTFQTGVMPTIALGGDNIDVATGSFAWPGAAGDQVVTGVGFEPQLVMFLWNKVDAFNTNTAPPVGGAMGFGAADGTDQFGFYSKNSGGNAGAATYRTDRAILCSTFSAVLATGELTSMDSDGFTVAFDGADTGEANTVSPRLIGWIALRDSEGGFKVGTGLAPGSTGAQAFTGCGFEPDQVIIGHANIAAPDVINPTTPVGLGSWGFGMFDDTLQAALLNGNQLRPFPLYSARVMDDVAAMFCGTTYDTLDAVAERASMDPDGFTLDWTLADTSGMPFGWIAMHTTGGNGDCGGTPPVQVAAYQRMYGWRASIDDNALETVEVFTSPQGFTS